MNDHVKFAAEYVINALNAFGVIKDAQCNATVKAYAAQKIQEYFDGHTLDVVQKPKI